MTTQTELERLKTELDEARAELARAIAWKEDAVLRCAKRRCADRDRIQRETEAEIDALARQLEEARKAADAAWLPEQETMFTENHELAAKLEASAAHDWERFTTKHNVAAIINRGEK